MDILLTHAYYLYEDPSEREVMKPYPPLGLLYIASSLRDQGFTVDVVDATFMSQDEHLARIEASEAATVGIYVNLMTRSNALQVIAAAKRGGATVVLGGPEPVNYVDEYFSRGVDIIVAGEGERTLQSLLTTLQSEGRSGLSGVDGIIYTDDAGETVTTPPRAQIKPLDNRPYPARDLIDMQRYLDTWKTFHGASSVSLITARGCPYTCRWCSHSVYGFSYRHRSPEDVAEELAYIQSEWAPDQVWYADDVFSMSRHWLRRFVEELEARDLFFPFETISREDRLDEEMIALLARLGCTRLWVGAESGSQKVLDAMDRRTDVVRMREVLALLKDHGIRAGTFIMLGYDGERWEDIDETAAHLRASMPDDVLTTLAYPIKGTPYYEDVADRIIAPHPWETSSDRTFSVQGRHSTRFYRHAQKWIKHEVGRDRENQAGRWIRGASHQLKSIGHRAAMHWYRGEIEGTSKA